MRYTHTQLADKVHALEALPPVNPPAENATRGAVA